MGKFAGISPYASGLDPVERQDSQYAFPYHYLPGLRPFSLHRRLRWGLEYMTYVSFVAGLVAERSPDSLLDVGCGDGRLLYEISPYVRHTSGVDLSERAVAFARAFNPGSDIHCNDVVNLKGVYEVVTLIEVLEHIPDDAMPNLLAGVSARLAPQGLLVVSVPTVNTPLNPKHYRRYTLESAKMTLEPYFTVEGKWWLYHHNLLEKIIRNLLCNDLWILNSKSAREFLWRIHKRFTYFANSRTGTHLILTASQRTD